MSYLTDLLGDAYKEGMTVEEISSALEAKQSEKEAQENAVLTAKDAEIATLKTQMQKANSEAAKYKKELSAHQTEDEKKKAEADAEVAEMKEQLEILRKEKKVSELKASYLALGYSDELAADTAKAFEEGDIAKVFENQKKFNAEFENSVKANLIKGVPAPTGGKGGTTVTRDDIRKMSDREKLAFYENHREEYEAAYKGE